MMGWIAGLLVCAGTILVYMAAPTQKLAAKPLPRPCLVGGWLALLLALAPLLAIMGPATAVFTWMTGAMLVWSFAPLAVAWWRGPPKGKR